MSVMGQVRREEACMLHIGSPWFLILQLEGGSLRKWSMASTYIALLSTGSIFTDSLILSLVFPGDWIWNSRRIGNSYVKFHCRLHIGIETALKVWRQGSCLPKNNWSCFFPYTIIQQVLNIGLKAGGRGNQERNGSEKLCLMAKMSLHRTPGGHFPPICESSPSQSFFCFDLTSPWFSLGFYYLFPKSRWPAGRNDWFIGCLCLKFHQHHSRVKRSSCQDSITVGYWSRQVPALYPEVSNHNWGKMICKQNPVYASTLGTTWQRRFCSFLLWLCFSLFCNVYHPQGRALFPWENTIRSSSPSFLNSSSILVTFFQSLGF